MVDCPECGAGMDTSMRREGGVVRTYYRCRACHARKAQPQQANAEDEDNESGDETQ
jgi:C4-type Zn-finger protein